MQLSRRIFTHNHWTLVVTFYLLITFCDVSAAACGFGLSLRMDIGKAKVPFVLFAGNSHPELANLIAEYVYTRNNVYIRTEIL